MVFGLGVPASPKEGVPAKTTLAQAGEEVCFG